MEATARGKRTLIIRPGLYKVNGRLPPFSKDVRTMPMELSVDFHFSSAHRLPYYDGPCFRLHGHNYRLQVTLAGKPDPRDGMIRDFEVIRRLVWETVLAQCDHQNLNDLMDNPTAENLISWMWERLQPRLEGLKELRLWETPEYCVAYRGD